MTHTTEIPLRIEIYGAEHELTATVGYTFTPGRPARFYPWPGDPPEPPEVEVLSVSTGTTDVLHWLSPEQIEALCEALLTLATEAEADADADRADREYDAWRDRQMERESDQ